MGAELRYCCPQQSFLQTSLYCQCELRPHVSWHPVPVILHTNLPVEIYTGYDYLFARSDIEYKELQLSEDQNQATKPCLSLTSSQDHRKHIKSKTVKMKTKLRAAPYPEVGLPLGLLIVFLTISVNQVGLQSHESCI